MEIGSKGLGLHVYISTLQQNLTKLKKKTLEEGFKRAKA